MDQPTLIHWKLSRDDQNVLWLTFDRQGSSVNSLNKAVFEEFAIAIRWIEATKPKAVVLRSGKKSGFIAGADIKEFTELKDADEALELVRGAQKVLDQLEALPMPTIAVIRGFCLGGGCEVALACKYRIAEDMPSTQIGLPEVKLGVHPGWGGTVRLPRLVGAIEAMKIMLPGGSVNALEAQRIGLVDVAVPERYLMRAITAFINNPPPVSQPKGLMGYTNLPWMRPLLGWWFERSLKQKVREAHYPAPFAIVRNWVKEGVLPEAYITEAKSIAKLLVSPTSRHLVRVFFLQERLKSLAKVKDAPVSWVHVIGAGTMGGDIAAWCALQGFHVTLQDQSADRIGLSIGRATQLCQKKLKEPRLVQNVLDRLVPDIEGHGISRADIVIEAVFEDINVKQSIYSEIESKLKDTAILATNTSSIPLDTLNKVLKNPGRFVGIHFFNPVSKMPLVEVVSAPETDQKTKERALAFVGGIRRLPLPVKSEPGFLVNRILMPYMLEALALWEDGVSITEIDEAARSYGMPMGPVELVDTVGLDVCLSVAEILVKVYGGTVPKILKEQAKAGHWGRKTGQGFYKYGKGAPVPVLENQVLIENQQKVPTEDIMDRLLFRMLNEVCAVWADEVISDEELLDAGMIFGTGFPPFRGGPLQVAKEWGLDALLNRFIVLEKQYGKRFQPHEKWSSLLKEEKKQGLLESSSQVKHARSKADSVSTLSQEL